MSILLVLSIDHYGKSQRYSFDNCECVEIEWVDGEGDGSNKLVIDLVTNDHKHVLSLEDGGRTTVYMYNARFYSTIYYYVSRYLYLY